MINVSNLMKTFGAASVAVNDVSFEAEDGSLVTLLGPSGCGKTTTLRLIAGLAKGDGGEISIDGHSVYSARKRKFIPPHRRPIGMVFQSYAIWPHMTVAQNVEFPLASMRPRLSTAIRREKVADALAVVGLEAVAGRSATALSGGQQQRVALARALVREPKVLLLDEPLSNLDAGLREKMRDEVRDLQQRLGITTILVTHDQAEALAISDKVIVMDGGKIVESGLPAEIYSAPRHAFTARFLGVSNAFAGQIGQLDSSGFAVLETDLGALRCASEGALPKGSRATAFIRPESFLLTRRHPTETSWQGTVRFSIFHGDCWDYHVDVRGQIIKVRIYKEKIGLAAGDQVWIEPEPGAAVLVPEEGEAATAAVPVEGPMPVAQ